MQIEIVIRPIKIRWHPGDEIFPILAGISLAELDAGNLCNGVGIVRRLQRTGEQRILRERLGGQFRINARAPEEEEFRHAKVGCRLDDKRIVVVKSSQHFYAGFAPIARDVRYCGAETGILRDFAFIPFKVFTRPYWPKVENPA